MAMGFPELILLSWAAILTNGGEIPGLEQKCYANIGDVNIGILLPMHDPGQDGDFCGPRLHDVSRVKALMGFIYMLEQINSRVDILPGVTLGFVAFDDCHRDVTALARSTQFIPDESTNDVIKFGHVTNCSDGHHHFKVSGIVGPASSRQAVKVASLMSVYRIPTIGILSTSDELSDTERYGYFLRVVPPDRFQAKAIIDFLHHNNWSYVSLVYSEASYGENGAKWIDTYGKKLGICFASQIKLPFILTQTDINNALNTLLDRPNAHVVVVFLEVLHIKPLFEVVHNRGMRGKFIWIGSDTLSFEDSGPGGHGLFAIHFKSGNSQPFEDYFYSLTPDDDQNVNPWINEMWDLAYGCENEADSNKSKSGEDLDCQIDANATLPRIHSSLMANKAMDGLLVYAHALDSLIRSDCPLAFNNVSLLHDCLKPNTLLKVMKETRFIGITDNIVFNKDGDLLGQYVIKQHIHPAAGLHQLTPVATWHKESETLHIVPNSIKWITSKGVTNETAVPESVCSKPCNAREYILQKELPCCWECKSCRENEILVNASGCAACDANTWPDEAQSTVCEDIPPSHLIWSDPLAIGLSVAFLVCFCCWVAVVVLYLLNKESRLIKASCLELSCVILVGIVFAFITVPTFISKPSSLSCTANRVGFTLSITFIYAPLIVKTCRIYRIFKSGKRGFKKPRFISTSVQMGVVAVLSSLQIILVLITSLKYPAVATIRMPIPTQKYTELFCYIPKHALLVPLSYNLALILICAVFGFLTRKLPENFNESWYICVSVFTTAFVWLVFLPTYFTTSSTSHQAALLAFCLIMNGNVNLLCLYFPKLYAVYFVAHNKIKYGNNMLTISTISNHSFVTSSRDTRFRRNFRVTPNGVEKSNN